jgi:hypothetical protein
MLFIGITAVCMWLGYEWHWVRQRKEFLAKQLAHHVGRYPHESRVADWWHRQLAVNDRAPGLLWLFGEQGVGRLWVVVPTHDIVQRGWPRDLAGDSTWDEVSALQPDYRRARRLFPEALVTPIRPDDPLPVRTEGLGALGFGGQYFDVTVREPSIALPKVRLVCAERVEEAATLTAQFVLDRAVAGAVLIRYFTFDRTCSGRMEETSVSGADTVCIPPGMTAIALELEIPRLSDAERASGGAHFRIKAGAVAGAVSDFTEVNVVVVPAPM